MAQKSNFVHDFANNAGHYWKSIKLRAVSLPYSTQQDITDVGADTSYVSTGMLTRPEVSRPKPRPRPETHKAKAKAKAKNANVNCRKNATVNLSILSHFRYSLEKLQ